MGFIRRSISKLQTGRIPQFAAAYGAASWVVLEVLDQLIGNCSNPRNQIQSANFVILHEKGEEG